MRNKIKKVSIIIFALIISISTYKIATNIYIKSVLLGDMNGDNKIDKNDAIAIIENIAKGKEGTTQEYISIADINNDGEVDIADALGVIRYEKEKSGETSRHSEWMEKLEQEIELKIPEEIRIDMTNGKTKKIEVEGKNYGELTYEIEESGIVVVSEEGEITGIKNGETQLIVKEDKGNIVLKSKIIVETSPSKIEIDKEDIELDLNGTKEETVTAEIKPATANRYTEIEWKSSNEKVAIVENGKITGIGQGEAVITAKTENGIEAEIRVEVNESPIKIELNKEEINLDINGNKEGMIEARISPATANIGKELTWASSNKNVAIVENGRVTGVGNGTAAIAVQTENNKVAICKVTVETSPLEIALSKSKAIIDLTGSKELELISTINPITANKNTELTWKSSNEEVAVIENGKVTGKSEGETEITVRTTNGKEATCKIEVVKTKEEIRAESIEIGNNESVIDLSGNRSITLKAIISPETANTEIDTTWESSNEKVATVENGIVTGIGNGETEITVRTANGKEAKSKVIVETSPIKIQLSKTAETIDLSLNKTATLETTISPETANTEIDTTWTSSNEKVATVKNGVITGIGNGEANIIAKTANGKETICKVTVGTSPMKISIDYKSGEEQFVKKGKTKELQTTISPATTNTKNKITWTSSNSSVATVDSNGKITGKSTGTTTITATTTNGKSAKKDIIVGPNTNIIDIEGMVNKGKLNTFVGEIQTKRVGSVMQDFAIVNYNKGNYLFIAQHSSGEKSVYLSKIKYDAQQKTVEKTDYQTYMKLKNYGHGASLETETNADKSGMWLWLSSYANGSDWETAFTRMKYNKGHVCNYYSGYNGENCVNNGKTWFFNNKEGKQIVGNIAIDEENDLLVCRTGSATQQIYDIYILSDWKNDKKTKISSVKHNVKLKSRTDKES